MTIKGKAKTFWQEPTNRSTRTRIGKEIYFSHKFFLLGSSEPVERTMESGEHSFAIDFHLPSCLPSSYESDSGHVRYSVKLKFRTKSSQTNYKLERPFTVISVTNLNLDPEAAKPAQLQTSKMICCLCCATGPVTAVFRIDHKGYVPGEAICINAEVQNNSNRKICSTEVKLKKCENFFAGKNNECSRIEYHTIQKVEHGPIEAGDTHVWSGDKLRVPPIAPSYLPGCSIIDLRYLLVFQVNIEDTPFDLDIPLDVIIGTEPLIYEYYAPPSMLRQPPINTGDIVVDATGNRQVYNQQPQRAILRPSIPTFIEHHSGPVGISIMKTDDEKKAVFFAPLYPYYRFE